MQFGRSYRLDELDQVIPIIRELLPFLIPVLIISVIIFFVAIVGLLKKKLPFREKVIWLVVIILFTLIGPAIYLVIGSKMLDEKVANGKDNQYERD